MIGKWYKDPSLEIYYDKTFRHYILRNQLNIEINPFTLPLSVPIKFEKDLQELFLQKFLQFRICLIKNLIAIQTENLSFVRNT